MGYRNAVGCGQARSPKSSVVFIVGDGDKEFCPVLSISVGSVNSMTVLSGRTYRTYTEIILLCERSKAFRTQELSMYLLKLTQSYLVRHCFSGSDTRFEGEHQAKIVS